MNMPRITPKTCLLLLAFAACARPADSTSPEQQESPPTPDAAAENAKLVRTAEVGSGTAVNMLEVTSNVESLDIVDVMPEKSEPVVAIFVEEGDQVKAGQLLATLRSSQAQLSVNEAMVKVAESQIALAQAQREYERDKRLVGENGKTAVLSQRDLETRLQTYETAKTTLQAAELAQQTAELSLSQCNIVSPIDGTITIRDISIGDMAASGTRVFQVIDLSSPRVIMNRPQRELSALRVGQKLTATSDALPGMVINGEIERISPAVDLTTGTIKVTAKLNPEQQIPNGVLVRIDLTLDSHPNATMLDKRALLNEGDKIFAFVVKDGVASKVQVFQGFSSEDKIEIDERTPINVGDLVVVVGADKLKNGDKITIAEE
jgi:RND family efflux transporter MFP subunit